MNIALVSRYIDPRAKSAIDIGSNEGIITCALGEMGVQAQGYEQSARYNGRAIRLAAQMGVGVSFENKLVTIEDINAMEDIDVIVLLSVHHQIAEHSSLDDANEFLKSLAKKARRQLFFQPACIQSKYKCEVPFTDNDYAAIEAYFNELLTDEMPYTKTVGFVQNDMPKSEPLRPLMVFSREPIAMQSVYDTAGTLNVFEKSVDKVHTVKLAFQNLGARYKKNKQF